MIPLILITFLLPLGARLLAGVAIAGFHEYEAFFVYGTDLLVVLLLWVILKRHRLLLVSRLRTAPTVYLWVFVVACALSVLSAPSAALALYGFVRIVLLILCAFSIGALASREHAFAALCACLIASAVIQGGLGIAQFASQKDLGLHQMGEPQLIAFSGSASTITVPTEGRFLRAYGTFPHPNIFAGFMVLGLLAAGLWFVKTDLALMKELAGHSRRWWRSRGHFIEALNAYITNPLFHLKLLLVGASWIMVLGLIVSFSRSGWIAAGIACAVFVACLIRYYPGAMLRFGLMVTACIIVGYGLAAPLVAPRAVVARGQPAVDDRLVYTRIGFDMIARNPFGVGIGNQVLQGVRTGMYQQYGMRSVYMWEPIHSLYVLIFVELGVLGVLSFVVFLGMVVWRLARSITPEKAFILSVLGGFMVIGFLDHYLWTIQPGRLMLWLVVGLALSQLPVANKKA